MGELKIIVARTIALLDVFSRENGVEVICIDNEPEVLPYIIDVLPDAPEAMVFKKEQSWHKLNKGKLSKRARRC